MGNRSLLNLILHDDALTRGLEDPEARVLVERLAELSERCGERGTDASDMLMRTERLRRRGRAIRQFIDLWCHRGEHAAAIQLAASERIPLAAPRARRRPVVIDAHDSRLGGPRPRTERGLKPAATGIRSFGFANRNTSRGLPRFPNWHLPDTCIFIRPVSYKIAQDPSLDTPFPCVDLPARISFIE